MKGIFFGLGVGPGDPELITIKALKILNKTDFLIYPSFEKGKQLAYITIKKYLKSSTEVYPFELPSLLQKKNINSSYKKMAMMISEKLNKNQNVVYICEGDPFFYGSFIKIYNLLNKNFEIKVIPGISSLMACSSVSGIPLVSENQSLLVIPAILSKNQIIEKLKFIDRVVFIKIGKNYKKIFKILKNLDLLKHSICVEKATFPDQRIRKLEEIDKNDVLYFSSILVLKKNE